MRRLAIIIMAVLTFLCLVPTAGAQEVEPEALLKAFPEAPDASQPLSRGAFAALLVKAAGLPTIETQNDLSGDIDKQSWFTPALLTLKDKGIMRGYPDGTMRPLQPLNRLEAVVMTARALGLPDTVSALGEVPTLAKNHWGYALYSWFLNQELLSPDDDPRARLSINEAAALLAKVFGSDAKALAIVEKAQQAQAKVKGVSFRGDLTMWLHPRTGTTTKEFPEMKINSQIKSALVLPATLHQQFQMQFEIPGSGEGATQTPPNLEMEQYLVDGVMYQKLTDPQSGKAEWVRLPKGLLPDIEAIMKQAQKSNLYKQGIPKELRPYFHYQLLGTITLAGREVYKIGYYGRIDDFAAFIKLAVPEAMQGMVSTPEFKEGINKAGELIKMVSYWGIDYIGTDDYLAYASEFKAIIAYGDKFAGQPFPLDTMEMQMKVGEYTYGDEITIEVPPEALEAKELPLPKEDTSVPASN